MSRVEGSVLGIRPPADMGVRTAIQVVRAGTQAAPVAAELLALDAPVARLLVDGLGRVTHLDAAAEALVGVRAAEAIGRPIEQVAPVSGLSERVRRVIDGAAPALQRDDGALADRAGGDARRVLERVEPIASVDRTPVGALVTLEDALAASVVAARRAALAALERAEAAATPEQVLRALVEALAPGLGHAALVRVLDADGVVSARAAATPVQAAALAAVEPLLGVAAENEPPLGRALVRLDRALVVAPTPEAAQDLVADRRLADAARDLALRSLLVVPLRARSGVGVLAVGSLERTFDAVDLAFAEALARRATVLLERVGAQVRLERAIKTRERLLSRMSHDLINPASAICMATDILIARLRPGEPSAKELHMIQRSANQLNEMIRSAADESASEASQAR